MVPTQDFQNIWFETELKKNQKLLIFIGRFWRHGRNFRSNEAESNLWRSKFTQKSLFGYFLKVCSRKMVEKLSCLISWVKIYQKI